MEEKNENEPPKSRIILNTDLPAPPSPYANLPPGPEVEAITHYLKLPADISAEDFDLHISQLNERVNDEAYGGSYSFNRATIEHAAMLDVAFRYFFSGGEATKPNEKSFVLAMKAQELYLQSLGHVRDAKRKERLDDMYWEDLRTKMDSRRLRNSEKCQKLRETPERSRSPYDSVKD